MLLRSCGLLALALALGCGPSLSAETRWVQWFSYRWILDIAVTDAGEAVVVGRTTGSEVLPSGHEHLGASRPFLARIDADGTPRDAWTGLLGQATGVALDEQGRAYVLLRSLRDGEDWSEDPRCELRALDREGQLRWSWPPQSSEGSGCPRDVVIAGDTVVVLLGSEQLQGLDLEGRERWQAPAPATLSSLRSLAAEGDAIWLADEVRSGGSLDRTVAWRYDARDGSQAEIELELERGEWELGSFRPVPAGLLATVYRRYDASRPTEVQLVSFNLEGRQDWSRTITMAPTSPDAPAGWYIHALHARGDRRRPWLLGSEYWHDGPASLPSPEHYRLLAQRFAGDGELAGTLRRSFVAVEPGSEAPVEPAVLARSDCPDTDSIVLGSRSYHGVVRGDELLIAGLQGCRDSFLLKLRVAQ